MREKKGYRPALELMNLCGFDKNPKLTGKQVMELEHISDTRTLKKKFGMGKKDVIFVTDYVALTCR